jgi:hypothetical protein
MILPPSKTVNASRHKHGASPGSWEANRISSTVNFAVSGIDRVASQAPRDDTVRKRMNDAGINPDHIGQAAFVDFIRQTGIRV